MVAVCSRICRSPFVVSEAVVLMTAMEPPIEGHLLNAQRWLFHRIALCNQTTSLLQPTDWVPWGDKNNTELWMCQYFNIRPLLYL